jgi:hypothetical protein
LCYCREKGEKRRRGEEEKREKGRRGEEVFIP